MRTTDYESDLTDRQRAAPTMTFPEMSRRNAESLHGILAAIDTFEAELSSSVRTWPEGGKHGKLYTFSGVDGSGKSTQTSALVSYLNSLGVPAVGVKYHFSIANTSRVAVNNASFRDPSRSSIEERVTSLIAADLLAFLWSDVVDLLGGGTHVVLDRYVWDFVVLARTAYGSEAVAAAKLLAMAPIPDLSFLFTIPADDALARARSRDRPPSSAEAEPLISRKIAAYERLARTGAFVVLDGLADISLISRMVRAEVERMLV